VRDAFVTRLTELAMRDPRLVLVVGDLGYGVVDDFARLMPDQFVNAGVAEQSMMGIAAGLAATGRRVFVYSIANFPTLRCLEQIRNDLCYHQRNVTIVSVGAGVAYGTHGYTHHAVEDIAALRTLPGLRIISPADPVEARAAAELATLEPGPTYVRLGKNGERDLHPSGANVDLRSPILLRSGNDAHLLATGSITGNCLAAAELLATREGLQCAVHSCPMIRPFDLEWLDHLDPTVPLVTVEEHSREGGFGSLVLEVVNDRQRRIHLVRAGLDGVKFSRLGSQTFLRSLSGLDPEGIAHLVLCSVEAGVGGQQHD
jgi:transketolase